MSVCYVHVPGAVWPYNYPLHVKKTVDRITCAQRDWPRYCMACSMDSFCVKCFFFMYVCG